MSTVPSTGWILYLASTSRFVVADLVLELLLENVPDAELLLPAMDAGDGVCDVHQDAVLIHSVDGEFHSTDVACGDDHMFWYTTHCILHLNSPQKQHLSKLHMNTLYIAVLFPPKYWGLSVQPKIVKALDGNRIDPPRLLLFWRKLAQKLCFVRFKQLCKKLSDNGANFDHQRAPKNESWTIPFKVIICMYII